MLIIGWFFLGIQAAIVIGSLLGYGIFTARPGSASPSRSPSKVFSSGRFRDSPSAICFSADSPCLRMRFGTDRSKSALGIHGGLSREFAERA
jgi:hypothetical protein